MTEDLVESMQTSFEEYIAPTTSELEVVDIDAEVRALDGAPDLASEVVNTRRMRVTPGDYKRHGYSAGCLGCVHLQRNTGTSRNLIEVCRSRIEIALEQTDMGRLRKERAAARKDDRLTKELEKEDMLIQEGAKHSVVADIVDIRLEC